MKFPASCPHSSSASGKLVSFAFSSSRMFYAALHFFLCFRFGCSVVCYSQLCSDEHHCTTLSTCRMDSGYCYNRLVYISNNPGARGTESGCSTEFTSIMRGRCAGDPFDEEYTCVCSVDMCNEYFLNASTNRWPDETFTLRLISCAEDDVSNCVSHRDQTAPCKIDHRSYCALIQESKSSPAARRHGRAGYWPLIEYLYLSIREVICIQGLSPYLHIECYCKYDNCNDVDEYVERNVVSIDDSYPFIECRVDNRFYTSEDISKLKSNQSISVADDKRVCRGHSCFVTYQNEFNVSQPWISVQRGCMNYSRPWAFFDFDMQAEYGPRKRGIRICREEYCNNVHEKNILNEQFLFSGSVGLSGRFLISITCLLITLLI